MSWLRRKPDPITLREQALRHRIQQLETQIRQLRQRIADEQAQPRLRSTATAAATAQRSELAGPTPSLAEPRFEDVDHEQVQQPQKAEDDPAHYNELGLRKYDPFAGFRRWVGRIRKQPAPASPKLVSYLAAGSIHGLKPLRYEKRIARNWFLVVCAFFILMLWGLIYFYFRLR